MSFKLRFFLALMAITLSSSENITSVTDVNLPTPDVYGISNFDADGPIISWLIEENEDASAVLGYKFKSWEVGCVKKPKYRIVNGERVMNENEMPELHDYSTLSNFLEFTVEGVNNTDLLLKVPKDIRSDVPYLVLVAAYGVAGEGPVSSPFRFQYKGLFTCRHI